MGGDDAPNIVVNGADLALNKYPNLKLIFVGNKKKILPLVRNSKNLKNCEIIHADDTVKANQKPSQALRNGKNTSMWKSIELVANKRADAVVSAGNTGALMAMSKLQLRMIKGVTRPAIAAFFPTIKGKSCMLDLGANIECDERNLIHFAIMGSEFCKDIMGIKKPLIGILNVGEENQKGFDYLRKVGAELTRKENKLNYKGFIEGSDLASGKVDVVVTDGFTGNIALKTAEGIVGLFQEFLRRSFSANIFTKFSYFFARKAINDVKEKLDPRAHNGAVFLGLNGISVKSHGGTDSFGFSNAIGVAVEMINQDYLSEVYSKIRISNKFLELENRNNE